MFYQTNFTRKNLKEGGESQRYIIKNLYVQPKHKSVTLSVTQLCHGESLFFNMFWNFTSKSLPLHQKQACISPLQSAEATDPLLTKQWKESQTLPISVYFLFYLFFMLMSCKTMRSKICITGIYISFVARPQLRYIPDISQSRLAK